MGRLDIRPHISRPESLRSDQYFQNRLGKEDGRKAAEEEAITDKSLFRLGLTAQSNLL